MQRILVVDVDAERLEHVRGLLENLGLAVVTATRGQKAMGLLYGGASVDLVVTEVDLPDFDGYDLANYIGLLHSELPVVALTNERDLIEGIFDRVLHKSTPDSVILECLLGLLGSSGLPGDPAAESSSVAGPPGQSTH